MFQDSQGLNVTGSRSSVEAANHAVRDYCGWKGDAIGILQSALTNDPGFSLGASASATLYMLGNLRPDDPLVVNALKMAEQSRRGATSREARHLNAARAWAEGHHIAATAVWEDILIDYPRDLFALRFAHDAYFFLGHSLSIRDSVARVLPQWSGEDENYGFVLGQYAFGLEETGDFIKAEDIAKDAISINPEDGWAVHAMAHVLEMTGRQQEGIEFMQSSRPGWLAGEWLVPHNAWHYQLFLLESGRFAEVLADYDDYIRPRIVNDGFYDLVDAAQILWRMELAGGDVGDRWMELSSQLVKHVDERVLANNDIHVALGLAGAGDSPGIALLERALERYSLDDMDEDRRNSVTVGRRLVKGVLAFSQQRYDYVIDCILPIRHKIIRIGGSNAQRDIFSQILIVAAERAGKMSLARALLNERLAWRPTERTRVHLAKISAAAADEQGSVESKRSETVG